MLFTRCFPFRRFFPFSTFPRVRQQVKTFEDDDAKNYSAEIEKLTLESVIVKEVKREYLHQLQLSHQR